MAAARPASTLERRLPIIYCVAACLVVLLVLPTSLRQPAQRPNQTAELSPDAPPDKKQEAIISTFSRASSGVAGPSPASAVTTTTAAPPSAHPGAGEAAPLKPRSCLYGVGSPARQTFSVYSPLCAPAWEGDNGGATAKGVTADTVRVVVGSPAFNLGTNGPVAAAPSSNQSSKDHTWSVIQQWFNTRYQFWGRHIQLYLANSNEDPQQQRSVADAADAAYHPFAAAEGRLDAMQEFAHLGVIDFPEEADQFGERFLSSLAPYGYQWRGSVDLMMQMTGELVCKYLTGKPAIYAGDTALHAKPRVFGLLYQDNAVLAETDALLKRSLQACGVTLAAEVGFAGQNEYNGQSQDNQTVSSAVAKLRSQGVTTVIDAINQNANGSVTNQANLFGYRPEWLVTGLGETDSDGISSLTPNQTEWAHAFGIVGQQIQNDQLLAAQLEDGYQAYKEIEPTGAPDGQIISTIFPELQQIANGIQEAGPRLTPQTFEQGLIKMGMKPNVPTWSVGGGYAADKHAFPTDVGIGWYDPTANADGALRGGFRYIMGGHRFAPGQLQIDMSQLFRTGVARQSEVP